VENEKYENVDKYEELQPQPRRSLMETSMGIEPKLGCT
jgi:hypothetical protein